MGYVVISGHIYRRNRLHHLSGEYIFADFITGRIWSLNYTEGIKVNVSLLLKEEGVFIQTIGIDTEYNLYFCTFGKIFRLTLPE